MTNSICSIIYIKEVKRVKREDIKLGISLILSTILIIIINKKSYLTMLIMIELLTIEIVISSEYNVYVLVSYSTSNLDDIIGVFLSIIIICIGWTYR